jgi:hypothetical protein
MDVEAGAVGWTNRKRKHNERETTFAVVVDKDARCIAFLRPSPFQLETDCKNTPPKKVEEGV